MDKIDEALEWADQVADNAPGATHEAILAAEVRRLQAERARLLDEAAERGVAWLIEQTSHIDPALAATNSGKWLIKLREKQTAELRAAIKGAAHE